MNQDSFEVVHQRLRKQFGELVPLAGVAELLHSEGAAVRRAMTRNRDEPRMRLLRQARRKIGKRIFFPVDSIAALVAKPDESIREELDDQR